MAKTIPPPDPDQPDTSHAFADRTGRFPVDELLRQKGFKIHSRPRLGQARWEKEGVLFPEDEAVARLEPGLVKEARGGKKC